MSWNGSFSVDVVYQCIPIENATEREMHRVRSSLIKVAESLDEVVGGVGGAAPHDGPEDRQERLEGHAVVGAVLVHQFLHL